MYLPIKRGRSKRIIFDEFSFNKFQGFNWESWRRRWYLELAAKTADLSHCGVTAVWLPPPTQSVAPQGVACFLMYYFTNIDI